MRLVIRLMASLMAVMVLVLSIHAGIRVRRELTLFESDMTRDHRVIGQMLATALQWTWRDQGQETTLDLVEAVNQSWSRFHIRWHWIDECEARETTPCLPPSQLAVLRQEHRVWWVEDGRPGEAMLRTFVLVDPPGLRGGLIELAEPVAEWRAYVRESILRTVVAVMIIVALCGAMAIVLGMWFVGGPVRKLIDKARKVGEGDFSQPLVLGQRDELADLAREMNLMSDRLDRATRERQAAIEQLRHADRLSTVGKLASGLAHELGTPLHVVAARARSIVKGRAQGQAVLDAAEIIAEQAERMTGIIRQLLDFAHSRHLKPSSTDLVLAVGQTLDMLEPLAQKAGVTFAFARPPAALQARLDRALFQQALTNLVVNGIQAMPEGGTLEIELGRADRAPRGRAGAEPRPHLIVQVRDQGIGIPADVLPLIFDPFFTTKEVREGTGLGLSVTYGIIEEHGGFIEVQSEPGKGSCFSICLPGEEGA